MPLLYGAKLAKERDCYAGGGAFGWDGLYYPKRKIVKKGRATLGHPSLFARTIATRPATSLQTPPILALLRLADYPCGAGICARAAIDAKARVNLVDAPFAYGIYRANGNARPAGHAILRNHIRHRFSSLLLVSNCTAKVGAILRWNAPQSARLGNTEVV